MRSANATKLRRPRGITLIEIAIMLMIMSFTVGAVFKGQELIFNARAKALIAQTEQARIAFFGFQDRFRALPGDYRDAPANIPKVTHNGNGNGLIEWGGTPVGTNGVADEDTIVWDHLSKSGFFPATLSYVPGNPLSAMPRNIFDGYIGLNFDHDYGNPAAPQPSDRHLIKTGNQIPVEFLAEMDLKVDDGNALRGGFQFSTYAFTGSAPIGPPAANACVDASGNWNLSATPRPNNCGAATLM